MSLNATHLRFALEVQKKYSVENLNQYLAGSIYPDSRYLTGATRDQTHPKTLHPTSDFERGWAAHLWCDETCYHCRHDLFKDFIKESPTPVPAFSQKWIFSTALKTLQDIDDARQFNIIEYLPNLSYVDNRSGENLAELEKFNAFFKNFYKNPRQLTIENYRESLKFFKIEDSIIDKLLKTAKEIQAQPKIMKKVKTSYTYMIKIAPQFEEKFT